MSSRGIAYIGQKRTVAGLSGYGLGDAQIDAQNRVTSDIGNVLVSYNSTKNAGQLTASFVQGAMNQIQQLVTNYAQQYASTKRGEAGRVTLQTFIDTQIFPAMRADFAALSQSAPGQTFDGSAPVSTPYNGGTGSSTVVNVTSPGGTANGATSAMQPSQSPGAPAGIQIPGYETTVTASAPAWYENPYYLAAAAVIALVIFKGKR